jgi:hypothetical protein
MNINTFSQEYKSFTEKSGKKRFDGVGCWMGEMKSGIIYLLYPKSLLIINKRISQIENICKCLGGSVLFKDVIGKRIGRHYKH